MHRQQFVPTPRQCQKIVRVRRLGLCASARAQYEADPLLRWLINSLWVIGTVDGVNERPPFESDDAAIARHRGAGALTRLSA